MAATSFDDLINVLAISKAVFWQENESLPEIEIQRLWQLRWNCLQSRVDGTSERHGSTIPSKRSIPRTLSSDGHPPSERQKLSPSSHPLEQQTSAPAGTSMGRIYTQSPASRPIPITNRRMSGTVVPIRPQASQLRRGNTETIYSFQNPVAHTTAQPTDYMSQSPDFTWPISYSSSPPTSDAIASTATRSVMSRSNTDDVLSGTIGMLRADSAASHCNYSKIVEVTPDDGTIWRKAEIPRTTRQQPQSKNTFCQLCDDHPQGFHGEHELRRHVERHHATRKVWICKDSTLKDAPCPEVPLSNCKACRNSKTYGANYNAAAHLRRAHFFPCKNKRGGRGKVSEGRGGMGATEEPSMGELKNWMYEKIEINVASSVLESTSPELSQIDADIFTEFNQFDDALSYNHHTFGIPQESASSYDWNTTQFGVDLVRESCQSINSSDSVID